MLSVLIVSIIVRNNHQIITLYAVLSSLRLMTDSRKKRKSSVCRAVRQKEECMGDKRPGPSAARSIRGGARDLIGPGI